MGNETTNIKAIDYAPTEQDNTAREEEPDNSTSDTKYNEDIISQLLALSVATRDEITNAMDKVVNPNDINEITDYIAARHANANDNDNDNDNDNVEAKPDPTDAENADDVVYVMQNGALYMISRDDYNRLMQQQQENENENENPANNADAGKQKEEDKQQQKANEKKQREEEYDSITKQHHAENELLVHGYIHSENKGKPAIASKIFAVCLQFYEISYLNLLKLCGNEFINKNEETLTFNQCIRGYDMIAFYFSAAWCPPSFTFTAKVATLYQVAIAKQYKLQIIFVSLDRSATAMMDYYHNHHGNYLAIKYANGDRKDLLSNIFDCEYIPHLCVINNECNLLDLNARNTLDEKQFIPALQFWSETDMKLCRQLAIKKRDKQIEQQLQDNIIAQYEDADALIVNGYIHQSCEGLNFEWIMPAAIFSVCFEFYHVCYRRLLKLCGDKFVRRNGETVNFTDGVKGYDMVGFYFSAIWCPPSKAFTPKLKQAFDAANVANVDSEDKENCKRLQIVFVSSDQSQEEMMSYFKNYHGDYVAVGFEDKARKELLGKVFECEYIPHLCVVSNQCEMLDSTARNTVLNYKEKAVEVWGEKSVSELMIQ